MHDSSQRQIDSFSVDARIDSGIFVRQYKSIAVLSHNTAVFPGMYPHDFFAIMIVFLLAPILHRRTDADTRTRSCMY